MTADLPTLAARVEQAEGPSRALLPCACGEPVRLGAFKITLNRKRGVSHYISHRRGGKFGDACTPSVDAGGGVGRDFICAMMKPYPKRDEDKPWVKMMLDWNAAVTRSRVESP